MSNIFLRLAAAATLVSGLLVSAQTAVAQTYPAKPIRLIVPWATGTPGDVTGRTTAERLAGALGQPIAVENKPGASGTIGLAEVMRQPADGYTLYLLASPSTLVSPALYPSQNIDLQKNLAPIGLLAWSYNVLVTSPASKLASLSDIVSAAKAKQGALSFASGGNGTPAHLAGVLLEQRTGTSMLHVPYNQFPLAITDLVAGRVDFMFLTASAAIPQIAAGKLKAIAVTSAKRLGALPNVPTMVEQGFQDFVFRGFEMLTVKQGTPKEIVDKLVSALAQAQASGELKAKLDPLALEVEPMSPAASANVLTTQQQELLRLARSIELKAD